MNKKDPDYDVLSIIDGPWISPEGAAKVDFNSNWTVDESKMFVDYLKTNGKHYQKLMDVLGNKNYDSCSRHGIRLAKKLKMKEDRTDEENKLIEIIETPLEKFWNEE